MAGPTTIHNDGDVVGYIVLTWTDGMGWQDDWDGQVHDTYAEALASWTEAPNDNKELLCDNRFMVVECRKVVRCRLGSLCADCKARRAQLGARPDTAPTDSADTRRACTTANHTNWPESDRSSDVASDIPSERTP